MRRSAVDRWADVRFSLNTEWVVDSFPESRGKSLQFPRKFVPAHAPEQNIPGSVRRTNLDVVKCGVFPPVWSALDADPVAWTQRELLRPVPLGRVASYFPRG